jgi:hypothetical protein
VEFEVPMHFEYSPKMFSPKTLQHRISVKLDRRKVQFSAFCSAVLSLRMISLRRIQNLPRFGRLGVGNVSPVTICGMFANFGAKYLGKARPSKGIV